MPDDNCPECGSRAIDIPCGLGVVLRGCNKCKLVIIQSFHEQKTSYYGDMK